MRKNLTAAILGLLLVAVSFNAPAATPPPPVPAFSVNYMDRSVDPSTDFYHFADGQWLKNNPVPPDKSRWASFTELAERNWYLIHEILNSAAARERRCRRIRPGAKSAIFSPRSWTPTGLNNSASSRSPAT